MNWGKLRIPAEQHLKISKSCCELGTSWKYSLRPTLKNLDFESIEKLGKTMSKFIFHC